MRMSRRSFLKASAATGIGAALLHGNARAQASATDDDRPLPDGPGGPLAQGEWKPLGCAGCTSWCSKEVYVLDGRMIKVRGNARSKVNGGAGCVRSHLILQMVYD
ncbi:MAG: twin-arginine translocation signal domain-containing protein, partial [Trueperaceae bacterium]